MRESLQPCLTRLVKLTLCLTMYLFMQTYPVLSQAPRHGSIGEWRFSCTHS